MKKFYRFFILICTISLRLNFSFSSNEKIGLRFPDFHGTKEIINFPLPNYTNLPDNHLHKFVGVNQPFSNITYEPNDLVGLQGLSHISAQKNHLLRNEAAKNLENLANAFFDEFGVNIVVVSAYRSYNYQKNSISESCKQSGRCAREGESEHQLGLAVDLRETTNEEKFLAKYQKYYNWLKNNAHLYGFHQSYQNGRKSDGYYTEPRHWRYLGINLATLLHEKNLTFTQYVNLSKN